MKLIANKHMKLINKKFRVILNPQKMMKKYLKKYLKKKKKIKKNKKRKRVLKRKKIRRERKIKKLKKMSFEKIFIVFHQIAKLHIIKFFIIYYLRYN